MLFKHMCFFCERNLVWGQIGDALEERVLAAESLHISNRLGLLCNGMLVRLEIALVKTQSRCIASGEPSSTEGVNPSTSLKSSAGRCATQLQL